MHREEDNFKGSPQARPREKLGEGDAREETSCQSPEERRRGKVQCHGNQRGSKSISRKKQLQGSRVEQGVESPGPPALLGKAGLDLSQLRTDLSRVHRNWKTRGWLSGRCTDSGGNAGRPHISGFGRERRGMGGRRHGEDTGDARVGCQAPGKSPGGSSREFRKRAGCGRTPGQAGELIMSQRSANPV